MKKTLRQHRLANGITQAHMAKSLGVHRATYSNYEKGIVKTPVCALIVAANILHISPDEISDGTHR